MFPILDTERLVLRELTEHDAQEVLNCFSNLDVFATMGKIL